MIHFGLCTQDNTKRDLNLKKKGQMNIRKHVKMKDGHKYTIISYKNVPKI